MMKPAAIIGAGLVGAYLWKGRDIRAAISMSGPGWDNLHPDMQRAALRVIEKANKVFKPQGLSVGAFEGWRSIARQREVMGKGASFVSDPLSSYHVWGLAVDFVFVDRLGRWTWAPFGQVECAWYEVFCDDPNRAAWQRLGEIIEGEGLEWGGRWRSFDGPHGQLTTAGKVAQLRAKYGEPDNVEWARWV